MKNVLLFAVCFFFTSLTFSQDWTWMKGTDTLTKPGIYGTLGVPSPSNNPGARHGSATWVDNSGNLWLFGGEGITTNTVLCWLNDLWKYDVTTGNWTWVKGSNLPNQNGNYGTKGVPSTTNNPGAREFMMSWTDASGNFWMFGGEGFPATGGIGGLNDLWRYNPSTNEWTWMHGANFIDDPGIYGTKGVSAAGNTPGARHGSGAAFDNIGNLWLFGGYGNDATSSQGNLNDLWKYSISTNQWVWMSGTNLINQYGNYGTLTVASPTNNPGGREFPACWFDNNNNIWLYGGGGFSAAPPQGHLGDLWKYSVTGNTWTWMKGFNVVNQQGSYGTQNIPSATNVPGTRFAAANWKDLAGNLWLFGGTGYATSAIPGRLNDLFMYNISTNEWSWEHGLPMTNSNGNYGVQTVPAPFNMPGARYYNTWWHQTNGNFWLFGGLGFAAVGGAPNNMNDLWKFAPACAAVNISSSSAMNICNGNTTTLTAVPSSSGTISWFATSTSTTALSTGTTFITPTLSAISGPSVYTYYAEPSVCPARIAITITVNTTPTLAIFTDNPIICAGTTLSLTANGANTYTWNTAATGSFIVVSPSVTTTYSLTGTDANGCKGTATLTQSVSLCTGIENHNGIVLNYEISPNPNNGSFSVLSGMDELAMEIFNSIGQKVHSQILSRGRNFTNCLLPQGVYFYILRSKDKNVKSGKLIIE